MIISQLFASNRFAQQGRKFRLAVNRWKNYGQHLKSTISFSTVGLELALAVGLGYWVGDTLDGWLQTTPYLMIVMVLVGSAAGFLNLFRNLRRLNTGKNE